MVGITDRCVLQVMRKLILRKVQSSYSLSLEARRIARGTYRVSSVDLRLSGGNRLACLIGLAFCKRGGGQGYERGEGSGR